MAPHCQQRAGQRWARQPGDRVERGQGRGDGEGGLPPRRGHQHQVTASVIYLYMLSFLYYNKLHHGINLNLRFIFYKIEFSKISIL